MNTDPFVEMFDEDGDLYASINVEESNLEQLAHFINLVNEKKGWNAERPASEWAILAVTEIAEAYEEHRNGHDPDEIYESDGGKPEGQAIEYADLLIRVLHWFSIHNINPTDIMALKLRYNVTRPFRHGGKRS